MLSLDIEVINIASAHGSNIKRQKPGTVHLINKKVLRTLGHGRVTIGRLEDQGESLRACT